MINIYTNKRSLFIWAWLDDIKRWVNKRHLRRTERDKAELWSLEIRIRLTEMVTRRQVLEILSKSQREICFEMNKEGIPTSSNDDWLCGGK